MTALQFLLTALGYEKSDNPDLDLWRKVTDGATEHIHESDPSYDWVASIEAEDVGKYMFQLKKAMNPGDDEFRAALLNNTLTSR